LILSKLFYSSTDAKVNCLKNNFKIYIKINIDPLKAELNPIWNLLVLLGAHPILHVSRIRIKTAPTYFVAVTPSSRSALLVLAKVTVVKLAN